MEETNWNTDKASEFQAKSRSYFESFQFVLKLTWCSSETKELPNILFCRSNFKKVAKKVESEEDDDFATIAAAKRHKPGSGKVSFLQIKGKVDKTICRLNDSSRVVARSEYEGRGHEKEFR